MLLFQVDRRLPESLSSQVAGKIRQLIETGAVQPGALLPSTRELARTAGISRSVTIIAYEKLASEGYIRSRHGSGIYVNDLPPEKCMSAGGLSGGTKFQPARPIIAKLMAKQHTVRHDAKRAAIDFWVQRPDPRMFPFQTWRRQLINALNHAGSNLIDYGDPVGLLELRKMIAETLVAARGIKTTSDNIFIFAGAQLALNFVVRLIARSGDVAVIENPCNQGAAYLLESLDMRLVPTMVDDDGLVTDSLPEGAALAYVTPSHQFPLGVTMSLERRHQLLEWANKYRTCIIEDDYDGHFTYDRPPLPALKAIADDNVVYLGTFSKLLGAGLRVGYAVLPSSMVESARAAKALLDNGSPWLEQAALASFIQGGAMKRHLRQVRLEYQLRRDCLIEQMHHWFKDPVLTGADCGTHICWHLPPSGPHASKLAEAGLRQGAAVYTIDSGGAMYYPASSGRDNILMIGYATLSREKIKRGIERLADAYAELA